MHCPDEISAKSRHEPWEALCSWSADGSKGEAAGKLAYDGHGLLLLHSMRVVEPETYKDTLPAEFIERADTVLETGEYAVLEGLRMRRYSSGVCGLPVHKTTYRAARAFVGKRALNAEKFDGISAQFPGLPAWMHQYPATQKTDRDETAPEPELTTGPTLDLDDCTTLEIGRSYSVRHTFSPDEVTRRQSAELLLISKTPAALDTLHDKAVRFGNLLTLATGARTPPTSIMVRADGDWAGFFGAYRVEDAQIDLDPYNFRFFYADIKDRFRDVVRCWFNFYENHRKGLDLHFTTLMQARTMNLETEFWRTVQSLEAFHRADHADKQDLSDRLYDLLDIKYDVLDGENKQEFAHRVARMRNKYVHEGVLKREERLSVTDLYEMTKRLNLLWLARLIDALPLDSLKDKVVSDEIQRASQSRISSD